MESILQDNREVCFLCGGGRGLEPLDRHHVFGGAYRSLSERYGLVVWLHHSKCHIFGREAVHQCSRNNRRIRQYAQKKAMEYYGWSAEEYLQLFGKNEV